MKLRDGEPWIPADEYGRSLRGLTVNLLVADVARAVAFQTEVLGAQTTYVDPDFAVMSGFGSEWMMHADHTYNDHPLHGSLGPDMPRGIGTELRLHGCDPDQAEARALARGDIVLAGAMDKPHGLREAFIIDPDGYLWVPDVPVQGDQN